MDTILKILTVEKGLKVDEYMMIQTQKTALDKAQWA